MTNQSGSQLPALPPLVDLPVLRSTYCSQEVTDRALKLLWEKEPNLIREQVQYEPSNYDQTYIMQLAHIVDFFVNDASKQIEIPTTNLGMLDLLFELSRRLRVASGIPQWEVQGIPLMESPQAPPPTLPSIPIQTAKGQDSYFGVTQQIVDRIVSEAYLQAPELFFERAECLRRGGIWPWGISHLLKKVIRSLVHPEDLNGVRNEDLLLRVVSREISRRLGKYCQIQRFQIEGE